MIFHNVENDLFTFCLTLSNIPETKRDLVPPKWSNKESRNSIDSYILYRGPSGHCYESLRYGHVCST